MAYGFDRFLTTHTGSLPRPDDLIRAMFAKEEGVPVDRAALAARISEVVAGVVKKQVDSGIDLVNDSQYGDPAQPCLRAFENASSLWSDRAAPNRSEIVLSKFRQHAWKIGRNVESPRPSTLCSTSFLIIVIASRFRLMPADSGQLSRRSICPDCLDIPNA
jgi:hypothetical protein